MKVIRSILFYALSLTWGLPLTFIGVVAAVGLLCIGKKPKRHKECIYFEVGDDWGGVNLGIIIIVSKSSAKWQYLKNHEFGHAIQNCMYGFAMPFVVCIPSVIRYWYIEIRNRRGKDYPEYYSIWFERQASKLGTDYK